MARLRDLYQFTKYVRDVEYTDKVLQFQNNHHEAWKQYAEQTGISEKDAITLAERAAASRLISFKPLNDIDGPPNKVIVDMAGEDLIEKTVFGIIPKGIILAWLDKNKNFLTLLIAFVGAIVIGILNIVITLKNNCFR